MDALRLGRFIDRIGIQKPNNLRVAFSRFRLYSTVSPRAGPNSPRLNPKDRELTPDEQEEKDAEFRKRKTEWKRRQGYNAYSHSGRGGDGCVAFHREKFKPHGPPSGALGEPGAPVVLRVPLGTVVRELTRGDPRRTQDEWEAEEEAYAQLDKDERRQRWRERPLGRSAFKQAEWDLWRAEREMRAARRQRDAAPLALDLDHLPPDATARPRMRRSACRACSRTLGSSGAPNAGKSTLLRALTGGRARSAVAGYAFTTLNPVVGVVRVAEDGSFGSLTRDSQELLETFRFTIADNPGLIEDASDNVGLGHSFLRSMERSLALIYCQELEKYKPGMSARARMVIANKADLLGSDGDPEEVRLAREKLVRLEEFVRTNMGNDGSVLDVVPTSAKYSQNLRSIVHKLRTYVEEARLASSRTQSPFPCV
ncbi:P-loop containing nucleoside triphosphate hydrolase protein [Lactarius indigo]|nr:P-loop containing nucleoside triphosphate hydrolase protein [Lactarius indigo]